MATTPKPTAAQADAIVVEGNVARVTFENDETGFRVLRVRPEGRVTNPRVTALVQPDGTITVVGKMPPVTRGESVRAVGTLEVDPRHGPQMHAQMVTGAVPTTTAGIERYLAGGAIKGIGRKTAEKIVKKFGEKTLHVLDHDAGRLQEVPGLGGSRASALATAWKEQRGERELMIFLASLEVSPGLAHRIYRKYKDQAHAVVTRSPYRLALEVWGVGFKSADAIAQRLGIARDDPQRAQAGVLHVLQQLAEEGHTATPRDQLAERAARLLDQKPLGEGEEPSRDGHEVVDAATVTRALEALEVLLGAGLAEALPEGISHAPLAAHEAGVAAHVARLLAGTPHGSRELAGAARAIEGFEAVTGVTLAKAQRAAVELVARASFAVVTGGPGVGKTTVVRALLALFADPRGANLTVALAAPTGRAAKRMSEATGREAATIHRLLEVDPRKQRFTRDEEKPLGVGALIVDETSMVDVPLAHSLLRALSTGTRVVLVGDVDQLPSIGPGAVLRDVIQSGVVPVVRLTEVFRQAGASAIIAGAHAILRGDVPEPSGALSGGTSAKGGELFVIERGTPEEAAKTLVDVVERHIPRAFGLDPRRDVQVLVPMVRGLVGTRALNLELQARLNPPRENVGEVRRGGTVFRAGDRVMQMRNDYDREVFNGDVGFVGEILGAGGVTDDDDDSPPRLVVRLEEGRDVPYADEDLDDLTLAYACTVHKAQGSEYPAVVIGLVNQHFVMLARKLLYTAVTRAKRLVVLVGSKWALREAVRDARGEERRTTLARRLRESQ